MDLPETFALPIQGKPERLHLYRWIEGEESYVYDKFHEYQRDGHHDLALKDYDLEDFWIRQIVQYLDRARIALKAAAEARTTNDDSTAYLLERSAMQAVAKSMMTAKGCAEAMVRVFGAMPTPGVSSGEILEWQDE